MSTQVTCKNCGTEYDSALRSICPECQMNVSYLSCLGCGGIYDPSINQPYHECAYCNTRPPANWGEANYSAKAHETLHSSSSSSQGGGGGGGSFDFKTVVCPNCDTKYNASRERCPKCRLKLTLEPKFCVVCGNGFWDNNNSAKCTNCREPQIGETRTCGFCGESYTPTRGNMNCPSCYLKTCSICNKQFRSMKSQRTCPYCQNTPSDSGTPYPDSSSDSGTPYPDSSSDSGTPYPDSSSDSGTPYPDSSSDSGTPYPDSSSDSGTPYPDSSSDSGTPYPDSSSDSGAPYPDSSSDSGTPYPDSSSDSGTPYPDSSSAPVTEYPFGSSSSSSSSGTPYPPSSSSSSSSSSSYIVGGDSSSSSSSSSYIIGGDSSSSSSHPGEPPIDSSSSDPDDPPPVGEGPDEPEDSCSKSCSDSCSSSSCCEGPAMGSVQLNITFGRFPNFPGLPDGKLSLHSNMITPDLNSSRVFDFNHVASRRITVNDYESRSSAEAYSVAVRTPTGQPRFTTYSKDTYGGMVAKKEGGFRRGESLRPLDENRVPITRFNIAPSFFEESLEDGTRIIYDASSGGFESLTLPNGVTLTRQQWAEEFRIIREIDQYTMSSFKGQPVKYEMMNKESPTQEPRSFSQVRKGIIHQIWSKSDGLLDFVNTDSGYTIRHFLPEDIGDYDLALKRFPIAENAQPVKQWTVTVGAKVPECPLVLIGEEEIPYSSPAYLKFFRVVESTPTHSFVYRWFHPDASTLIFVKGQGDEAEVVKKTRTDLTVRQTPEGDMERIPEFVPIVRIGNSKTGQTMGVNGIPSSKILDHYSYFKGESCLVNGNPVGFPCYIKQTVYGSFDFGNVVIKESEGPPIAPLRVTEYTYGTSGGSTGRCTHEKRPDGSGISREYDSAGRLLSEREAWVGGGYRKTAFTYYNEYFNDKRVHTKTESIIKDGVETIITQETATIETTSTEIRTVTARSGLGVTHAETSEKITSVDPTKPLALGRVIYEKDQLGIETFSSYETVTTDDGVTPDDYAFKCIVETRVNGQIVPYRSVRNVLFFDKNARVLRRRRMLHTGADFTQVDEELYTYDYKGRPLSVQNALGTRTTEWSCLGPISETDENMVMTEYKYNFAGRNTKIIQHSTPHTYQFDGHQIPPVNFPAMESRFSYDGKGQLISETSVRGTFSATKTLEYDYCGRLVRSTDAMGKASTYDYVQNGLSVITTMPHGAIFITETHSDGSIVKKSGSGQQTRLYSFDLVEKGIRTRVYLNSLSGSDSILVEESIQNGLGQIVERKVPGGNNAWITTEFLYDERGLLYRKNETGKAPLVREFDLMGELTREALWLDTSRPLNTEQDRITDYSTAYALDSVSALGIYNVPFIRKTETVYSAEGLALTSLRESLVVPVMSSVRGAILEELTLTSDKRDKETLIWKENHNGNKLLCSKLPTSPKLDMQLQINGEIVAQLGRNDVFTHSTWEFQPTGWKKTLTDGRNLLHHETYNCLNQLVEKNEDGVTTKWNYDDQTEFLSEMIKPDGTTIKYTYDIRGNKLTESGSGTYSVRYEYDNSDRLVKLHTYRNLSDSGELGTGDITTWIYDNRNGLLLEKRFADGEGQTYSYDSLGRMSQMQHARTDVMTTYEYQSQTGELASVSYSDVTPNILYSYNFLGQCTSITDAAGTREFRYNILGEIEGEDYEIQEQGVSSSLNYNIDNFGRLIGHTLTLNGDTIQEESASYDEADRINMFMPDNQTHYIYDYREDNGWLDTLTYPNGLQKSITYEESKDYISHVRYNRTQGTQLSEQSVVRDSMGRITSLVESRLGQENRVHQYNYNPRGELTGDIVSGRESRTEAFTYDHSGNRLSMGTDISYTTNALNQYSNIQKDTGTPDSEQEPESFIPTYDSEGNQTTLQTITGEWEVTYNAESRPVTFTKGTSRIECVYDYKGRRIKKTIYEDNVKIQEKIFIYKGFLQQAELEILATTADQATNVIVKRTTWWDPSEPSATRPLSMALWTTNGKSYYQYTHTLNKNVSELIDSSGEIQASYDYDSFGQIVAESGTLVAENPFTFSSEYRDEELGLMYYNYRHYNPSDGRWINRDPYHKTYGYNLYRYCLNDPGNSSDSLGLFMDREYIYAKTAYIPKTIPRESIERTNDVLANPYDYIDSDIDDIQLALDALGILDPFGICDGANAIISVCRGNFTDAGLSAAGCLPYLGDAIKMGGKGRKAQKASTSATKMTSNELGKWGEEMLEKTVGKGRGQRQARMDTKQGTRIIDYFEDGVAHESKVGRVSATSEIKKQIDKDYELIQSKAIKGAEWHFWKNPQTGIGGPTKPLENLLRSKGIKVNIH